MMNKAIFWTVAPALLIAPIVARAQNAVAPPDIVPANARTVYIYSNALGLGENTLGNWGNGKAIISQEAGQPPADSVKISTRDFYQGGRFDLVAPIDLAPYQKAGFLRLKLRFYETAPVVMPEVAPGEPGAPAAAIAAPVAAAPAAAAPKAPRALGLPPAAANANPFGNAGGVPGMPPGEEGPEGIDFMGGPVQETPITQIRLAFIGDQGATVGLLPVDLSRVQADDEGWRTFALPISALRATPDARGPIKRIIVSGDMQDDFFMAQLALVSEVGKLNVVLRRETDAPGARLTELAMKPGVLNLIADVESGTADTIVEWDFDADNVRNLGQPKLGIVTDEVAAEPEAAVPAAGGAPAAAPAAAPVPAAGAAAGGAPVRGGGRRITTRRVDARGVTARFAYPQEDQDYRIEVTVRDRAGKKAPVKTSIRVKVRT